MSTNFRLRTGVRNAKGEVPATIDDVTFHAENVKEAIEAARNHPVSFFIGAGITPG